MRRWLLTFGVLSIVVQVAWAAESPSIDHETLDRWSAPYRGWYYWPDPIIPAEPKIPGHEAFRNTDCPCVYQLPGQPSKWYMSFIGFNGQGYNSFVAEDFSGMRGANYVPSYARNDVQLWMDYDPGVVNRELAYAERLKLNTVRVFLQVAVYEHDPKLFLERFENLLGLCEKHRLRMMPVVFDSCFGEFPDLMNYEDKNWMANPGQNRLSREHWPKLEQYVRDVVGGHKDDRRIVMWDVMNEPTCTSFDKPQDKELIWTFLRHFLDHVKEVDPNHPRTVGVEHSSLIPQVLDRVEVLCTHNYRNDLREDLRR